MHSSVAEPCWLAQWADTPCEGPIVRCHLLPRYLMRRELPHGLILVDRQWLPAQHPSRELREGQRWRLKKLLDDHRAVVPGCGNGGQGHHGALDVAKTLRIPREAIPSDVEFLAEQIGLLWWLDREYRQNGSS